MVLDGTKKRNQKRYTKIYHKPMENGDNDKLLSSVLGDDGEGSVHRGSTPRRNGSKIAKPSYHQWCAQQSHDFTSNIGQ